jgi:hypothetical protein
MDTSAMNVEVTPPTTCHRCGGELYLTAKVPHPTLPGTRTLSLCPRCDAHDPHAQGLLAFFAIHSRVGLASHPQLLTLAAEWIVAMQAEPTGASAAQLAHDADELRRHGDLT